MEKDNYSQQELFEQRKYISDLIEEKTEKKKKTITFDPKLAPKSMKIYKIRRGKTTYFRTLF